VPTYTLDDLLSGITAENRHAEADFGIAQGQEQF
jgi:antitoxin component of MazEF toxin-antitoxin module